MHRVVSLAAIALAIAVPSLALAQDVAAPPAPSAAPPAPPRFDLAASLAEGDEDLSAARAVELATGHSPRIEAARASVRVAEGSLHAATVGSAELCAMLRAATASVGSLMSTAVTFVAPPAAACTLKPPVAQNTSSTRAPSASPRTIARLSRWSKNAPVF